MADLRHVGENEQLIPPGLEHLFAAPDAPAQPEETLEDRQRWRRMNPQGSARPTHAAGRFISGITSGVTSLPEMVFGGWQQIFEAEAQAAYGLDEPERGDPTELATGNIMAIVSAGMQKEIDYQLPPNPEYSEEAFASIIPAAAGSLIGMAIGSKGVPIRAGFGKTLAKKVRGKPTGPRTLKGRAGRSIPTTIGNSLRARLGAWTKKKARFATQIGTVGMGMSSMEGFHDARAHMIYEAEKQGRTRLTNAELGKAWDAAAANAPAGLSEVFGAGSPSMKLFKWLDKSTNGAWGNMAMHWTFAASKGAFKEAAQENFQNSWLNYTAAHIAQYDRGRDLWLGAREATIGGSAIGFIMGGIQHAANRRGLLHRRILELRDKANKALESGAPESAKALNNSADKIEQRLLKDLKAPEILAENAFPSGLAVEGEAAAEAADVVYEIDESGEMKAVDAVTGEEVAEPVAPPVKAPEVTTPAGKRKVIKRDGVTIDVTDAAIDTAETSAMMTPVVKAVKEAEKRLGLEPGTLSLKTNNGETGGINVKPGDRGSGVIHVDLEALTKGEVMEVIKGLGERKVALAHLPQYIKKAMDEEARHVAHDRAMFADFLAAGGKESDTAGWMSFRKEQLEGVWSEMTEEERTGIVESRGDRGKEESNAALAEEFIRQEWQRIATGQTTEGWNKRRGWITKALDSIKRFFQRATGKGINKRIAKEIKAVEKFLKAQKGKGAEVAETEVTETEVAKTEVKAAEEVKPAKEKEASDYDIAMALSGPLSPKAYSLARSALEKGDVSVEEIAALEPSDGAKSVSVAQVREAIEKAAKPAEEAALDEDAMAEAADEAAEAAEVKPAKKKPAKKKAAKPTTEKAGAEAAKERADARTAKAEADFKARDEAAKKARAELTKRAEANAAAKLKENKPISSDSETLAEQIAKTVKAVVNNKMSERSAQQRDAARIFIERKLLKQAADGKFDNLTNEDLLGRLNHRAGLLVTDFNRSKEGIGATGARTELMDATSMQKEVGEDGGTVGDVMQDTGAVTPDEVLSLEQRAERMEEVLNEMDADQAAVLRHKMVEWSEKKSAEELGITRKKYRVLLENAKEEFKKRMSEKSGTKDHAQWAFDPLDESAMSEYSNDNAFKRDQFTKAQSGILPPGNSSPIKTTMGGERLPANGADFSDNVRRRAAAISQGIFRASEEIGLGLGLTPDEASVFTLDALLHPTEDVAVDKAAPLIKNLRRELRLLSLSKLKGEYKYHDKGSEAEVYHDIDNMAVYKIVSLLPDGGIGKAAPVGHFRADQSGYLEGYSLHKNQSFLQFSERLRAENNHGGFVFTEIVGVVESGIVTKQRYVNAADTSPADLAKHLRTRNLELMPPTAVEVMLGDDVQRAVSVIGNRAFVHGDLHHENVLKGTDGEVYIVDALTRELAPVEKVIPVIKRDLDRARGDVGEGTRQFAFDPMADQASSSPEFLEGLRKQKTAHSNLEYIIAHGNEREKENAAILRKGTTPDIDVEHVTDDFQKTSKFIYGRDNITGEVLDKIKMSVSDEYTTTTTLHEIAHGKSSRALNDVMERSAKRLGRDDLFQFGVGEGLRSDENIDWIEAVIDDYAKGGKPSESEMAVVELHLIHHRLARADPDFFKGVRSGRIGHDAYYGLSDVHEMIAEGLSDGQFQEFLDGLKMSDLIEPTDVPWTIDRGGRLGTLWDRFKKHIATLLGITYDDVTVLARVQSAAVALMEDPENTRLHDIKETAYMAEERRVRGRPEKDNVQFAFDPTARASDSTVEDNPYLAFLAARARTDFDEGLKKQKTVPDALKYIIANGSGGEAKYAKRLLEGTTLDDDVTITYVHELEQEGRRVDGLMRRVRGPGGSTRVLIDDAVNALGKPFYRVGIILHETAHVKTLGTIQDIVENSTFGRKDSLVDPDIDSWLEGVNEALGAGEKVSPKEVAAAELHMLFKRFSNDEEFSKAYGGQNTYEMIADAFSKPSFIALLKGRKISDLDALEGDSIFAAEERTLWEQFKESIAKLLGFNADEATVFERVMESSLEIMKAPSNASESSTKQYAFDPMAGDLDVGHTGNAGFFSKMIAVTERLPQDVWTPDQLLAKLKKSPGITQDEIDIIGLEEELDRMARDAVYLRIIYGREGLKPGQVHKEDVAAFIRMNQVQVDEVVVSGSETRWETYSGGDLVLKGYEPGTYREMRLTVPLNPTLTGTGPVKYQSSHWRDMNVVVHVRFNDRVDENGNKILFIEEIQSDWAKDYRNALGEGMGYTAEELAQWKADLKHYKALRDRTQKYRLKRDQLKGATVEEQLGDKLASNYNNMVMRLEQKIANAEDATPSLGGGRGTLVPEPTMKARHNDLAVKRMLRWAIENGYSKISWMNGTETAKRYSKLDNPVASLRVSRDQKKVVDGVRQWTYTVRYFGKKSNEEIRVPGYHTDVTKSRLAKLIGKKGAEEATSAADESHEAMLAERVPHAAVRRAMGVFITPEARYTLEKEVSQMDWAYTLYDQIIPQKFKKYAKKSGGSGALTDTVLSQQEGFELIVADPSEGSYTPSVHKTKKGAESVVMEEAAQHAESMYEFPEWVEVKEDAPIIRAGDTSNLRPQVYLVDKRSGQRLTSETILRSDPSGLVGNAKQHALLLMFRERLVFQAAESVVADKGGFNQITVSFSTDADPNTAYSEIFKPIHELVKEQVRNTTITEKTNSIVFQSIDIEQGMVDKNHELNATYAYDPLEGSNMSEEKAATFATKEQIDAVITAADSGEPVSVSFGGLGAKALRIIKGDWLSVVDTLESIGLSKLGHRVYQYEIKKGEYQGKLFAGMRNWEKPLTSTQIKEAHEEAGKYFEIREDYGSTQAVHALLTQMRKIEQRNRGEEQPDLTEYKRLERALSVIIKREARNARARAADYLTNMTNGNAINLIRVVEDTAEMTGGLSDELGIQVQDKGGWRPLKNMGRLHYPRRLSQRVLDVINEPSRDPALYQSLKDALVRDGLESDAAAEEYLAGMVSGAEMEGGEFMANVERARGLRMPKEFYDTSVDGYLQFLLQFSNRAAQVWAFGQTTNKSADAFGAAIKAARGDEAVRKYLQEVAKTVYRRRETPTKSSRFFERAVSITGITYLSGYFTAVRDFVSGVMLANEQFGFRATLPEGGRALVQAARAVGRTLWNVRNSNWKAESSELVEEAMGMGAIMEDFQQAQIMEERLSEGKGDKAISEVGNKALYFKQSMDRLARGVTMGASLNWLRASRAIYANRKGERPAQQRVAALKRLKFTEEEANLLLSGDQSLVEEFARRSVAEKQYTYSIAQHPLFMGNQSGIIKLMFQFQRWTFQRGRDIIKNVTSPLVFGTKVGGKKYRTAMPAIRFLAGGMLFGELLQWLAGLLTDKERRDPSLEEIEMAEEEKVSKALDRVIKDMVFTGATGLWGDYSMLAWNQATRGGRWKDPFKPPMFNLANDLIGAGRSWYQKGMSAEAAQQEFVEMARNIPIAKQTEGFGRGWYRAIEEAATGKPAEGLWAAKRDLAYTRTLARRFGEETGISVESKFNGIFADDKYTTQKVNLKDALLAGDIDAAREAKDTLIEMGMSLRSLKSVVRSNQPIRVGMQTKADTQNAFLRWARKNVPSGVARINRVQDRYRNTAGRLGL